ncbi:MAG: cytochrome c biogenesis protein CcsA [Rubripirellula sp.]
MATIASDLDDSLESERESRNTISLGVLNWLGSLKLTVALFAFSLIIVLVGTLAQDELNMLEVKQRYFLTWVAQLHIDDFFPQAFMPHEQTIPGVIPFPGGALIGLMLMVNLIAAKTTRFRIHSSGSRLINGAALMAAGVVIAGFIVFSGHSSDGLQGTPPISYQALWASVLASLTLLTAGLAYYGSRVTNPTIRSVVITAAVLVGGYVGYSLYSGQRIDDPGLRIVWQLTKGLGAGVVLLIGALMVFDKQGGNVVLHLGVGLLMLGQFMFGDRQLEQRLSLIEGESTNTLVNLDAVELTFMQSVDGEQKVIAIPGSRLRAANRSKTVIEDASLPVNVRVLDFFDNSTLIDVPGVNVANVGVGLEVAAREVPRSGGAESEMNLRSAYVEFLDLESGESLGKHLVSQLISDRKMLVPGAGTDDVFDSVTVGDTTYDVGMRFHREVKPYWVQLEDVRRINYSGTETPRDYSSFIRIVDPLTGEDRNERVWMNNPLRFRGETFYQSNYTSLPSGKELTGIQVVRNSGWLIPYVACSITALGMLAHFLGTLTRFLRRRERETKKEKADLAEFNLSPPSNWPVVALVGLFALIAFYRLVPWTAVKNQMRPAARMETFDLYSAGKLPVQFGGRVMPLDAYARQTLKAMSNKESLPMDEVPSQIKGRADGKKLSAMQWLMEVAVDEPQMRFVRMFRIDADEVLTELGLERDGRESKLYSLNELGQRWFAISKKVDAAAKKDTAELTFKERKLLELDRRTRQYTLAAAAFRLPVPEEIPSDEFERAFPGATDQDRKQFELRELRNRMDSLSNMPAPAIVAPTQNAADEAVNDPKWATFGAAFFDHVIAMAQAEQADEVNSRPGIKSFGDMLQAYGDEDTSGFNKAVDEHLESMQSYTIPGYNAGLVSMERWMQTNWPTGVAMFLYLVSMVLGLTYFLVNLPRLRTAVWGVLAVAMIIHTVAILCRISITGRAPVINLYSSAVFIGWAAVLFGLIVERIFKYGTGNMLAATSGVMTLLVAYGLNKGDTMPVLQAVLDTQFWLATHVISVTLGYVATLVAGTLGAGYLIAGWLGKDKKIMRDLYRCCYGAACFGILFSFVGTVLGGLWADDSWGRFWGWDPKENGALLIVIWNALVLHARWDGMVAARGFAALAIVGNIVTAWSWFGTNELGIGLHSYGFTSGVLRWLSLFVVSQLAIIAIDALLRVAKVRFGKVEPVA